MVVEKLLRIVVRTFHTQRGFFSGPDYMYVWKNITSIRYFYVSHLLPAFFRIIGGYRTRGGRHNCGAGADEPATIRGKLLRRLPIVHSIVRVGLDGP